MYHEVTVRHRQTMTDGQEKTVTSKILVSDAQLFAEAEYAAMAWAQDHEADVTAIRRSRIREFANDPDAGSKIYMLTLQSTFTDEGTGKQRHMRYAAALYADDLAQAKSEAETFIRQGYDGIDIIGINETAFRAVAETSNA